MPNNDDDDDSFTSAHEDNIT